MPRYKKYSELTFFEKLSIDFNKDGYEEARRKAENDDDCAYCIFSLIKCFCILSIFAIIIVSFFSPYFCLFCSFNLNNEINNNYTYYKNFSHYEFKETKKYLCVANLISSFSYTFTFWIFCINCCLCCCQRKTIIFIFHFFNFTTFAIDVFDIFIFIQLYFIYQKMRVERKIVLINGLRVISSFVNCIICLYISITICKINNILKNEEKTSNLGDLNIIEV